MPTTKLRNGKKETLVRARKAAGQTKLAFAKKRKTISEVS